MKKTYIYLIIIIILIAICALLLFNKAIGLFALPEDKNLPPEQQMNAQIESMISERRQKTLNDENTDPFGEDGIVKILFIGLDNRIGQTNGHCDAIQFIEFDKNKQKITIIAVPRGTYSPLPESGHPATDYYVSKACEVGGLEYGIKQIERILGQKADYVVFVGFSEAIGIFRQLDLPPDETMQWLRVRQGYAIGEPQRARNHSTFLKQMLIKFTHQLQDGYTLPVKYLVYKLLKTDLTFKQSILLAEEAAKIDAPNHPERVQLLMRPAYTVQDIPYDEANLNDKINSLIKPIAQVIPEGAYTGITVEESQQKVLDSIKNGIDDPEFVRWAFENYLWLQINDDLEREQAHYDLLVAYAPLQDDLEKQNNIITDYIIEMEDLGKADWAQKGKDFLVSISAN